MRRSINYSRVIATVAAAVWFVSFCGNVSTAFNVARNTTNGNVEQWFFYRHQCHHDQHHHHHNVNDHVLWDAGFTCVDVAFTSLTDAGRTIWLWLADIMLYLAACMVVVVLALERDACLTADTLWTHATLLVGKGIAQVLTIVPDSNMQRPVCCSPQFSEWGWWIVTRVHYECCGDMLYSGHTLHVMLALLVIRRSMLYGYGARLFGSFAHSVRVVLSLLFGMVFIITLLLSRLHYTIDIVVAGVLTLILFSHDRFLSIGRNWFEACK